MIAWCAHCQRFIGESPPFEDLELTHLVCQACADSVETMTGDVARAREIAHFIQGVGRSLAAGQLPRIVEVLDQARNLRIRDSDLLLGLLQPTLYEIGRRFETGDIGIADEHRVSQFVQALVDTVESERAGGGAKPWVLLVPAPGNTHTIGVRFLANALREEDIPADVMLDASAEKILRRLGQADYRIMGVSIALPSQAAAASDLARRARSLYPRLKLIAGGYPLKTAGGKHPVPEHFDSAVAHTELAQVLAEFHRRDPAGGRVNGSSA